MGLAFDSPYCEVSFRSALFRDYQSSEVTLGSVWWGGMVVHIEQQMFVGSLASQGGDANLSLRQIDIGADQAMAPERAGFKGSSQHGDLAVSVGFSEEDHGSFQRLLEVQRPVFGEEAASRGVVDARLRSGPIEPSRLVDCGT